MKVLILGGTRFIGSFVTTQLVEQGHEVFVFHRGETSQNIPHTVKHIYGDRGKLETYKDEFANILPDVVLDMLPLTEEDAVRVVETFQGITKRIVAISSADVYMAYERFTGLKNGPVMPTPLDETSPQRSVIFPYRSTFKPGEKMYDYDKILVEKTFMKSDIPSTVLRLPMVHGPFDRQNRIYNYLKQMIDERPYILLDEKQATWRTCRGYVENVACAIVLAITNEKAAGQIYNVADENSYSELEWVHLIKNMYGHWNGKIEVIPSGNIPAEANFEQNLDTCSAKIRNELGYSDIVSTKESLLRAIQWDLEERSKYLEELVLDYEEEDKIYEKIRLIK